MTTPEHPENETDQARQVREEPARTGPNRQPSNAFLANAGDTVAAVLNAYRVLAEYLKVGEQTARDRAGQSTNGSSTPGNPWAFFGGGPWAADQNGIPVQLFRAWVQMIASWADLTMIPNAGETIRQMARMVEALWGIAPPDTTEAKAAAAVGPRKIHVIVETSSTKPVAVDIEFDPPDEVVPCLQSLHPLRGDAPPLSGHELEYDRSTGRLSLSLAVPPSQPTGSYTGIIFDDRDDRPCGRVKVRVGDP